MTMRMLLIASLLMTACAAPQVYEKDATLVLLDGQSVKPENTEQELALKRKLVRQNYQTLVDTSDNQKLKLMAMQRLADLALEDSETQLLVVERDPAPQLQDPSIWQLASSNQPPAEDEDIKRAIGIYQQMLEQDPDNDGNARILYQLAWAYDLAGELEQSFVALSRLHEKYPAYEHDDEVQFRRGEILFSLRNFPKAEQAYQGVLDVGEQGEFFERALFKHGWSVFKQGDMQRALNSYFRLLDRYFADGRVISDFSRSEAEVLEDTFRVVSISFAYLENAQTIGDFFRQYGERNYQHKIYENLAALYLDQERIEDATSTLLEFVERYPLHARAPDFMVKVIDIYEQARLPSELLAAKARFINNYGVGTPYWSSGTPQALQGLAERLKLNLADLSSYYHARAQQGENVADYRAAIQWYRNYVQWFPADGQTPQMNFLLAESLQDSGDLQAAAQEFERSAYEYPRHEQSAEAAYAALLAFRQQLQSLQGAERLDKRQEMIASSNRFVTFFPVDRRVSAVKTSLAEEYVDLKIFPRAVAMATDVIRNEPRPTQSILLGNWEIIARGEFEAGNYAEAEEALLKLLEILPDDKPERELHRQRLAAAIYKQGEEAREKGDYRVAAQHFLRVGSLVPDASIRVNAEYDAAAAYTANQDWELAIPILQAFMVAYPQHELRDGAEERLALLYEKQGDWLNTAGAYEALYKKASDKEKKRLLLWQIAEYYQKADRWRDAINSYKRYVKDFPKPFAEAMEARQRVADIYQANNKIGERRWWLGQIIKLDKKGPSTERSHYLAAMAALELAQAKSDEFVQLRLTLPLKKKLRKKKALMKDSLQALARAAEYGVQAVTTESTYRIGEVYRSFSQGLLDSQRPTGLSREELEQYDILLEEQAYPFEEKAIDAHAVNAQRANGGVYDEWVRKSFSALAGLNPGRYARSEKIEVVNEKLR